MTNILKQKVESKMWQITIEAQVDPLSTQMMTEQFFGIAIGKFQVSVGYLFHYYCIFCVSSLFIITQCVRYYIYEYKKYFLNLNLMHYCTKEIFKYR